MSNQVDVDALLKDDGPVNPYTTSGTVPWQQSDYDKYDRYQASHGGGGGGGQITDTAQRLPTAASMGGAGGVAGVAASVADAVASFGSDDWLNSADSAVSSGMQDVGSWFGL